MPASLLTEAGDCALFIKQCNYIGILLFTACPVCPPHGMWYTGDLHWQSCTSVAMAVEVLLHKQGNRKLKSIQILSHIDTDMLTSTSEGQWHGSFLN